ncbi:DUF805 domain-containing protein [Bifidobacterium sp. ESL0682]|uniref:DUF805 domain-containing protein n=1 Tax=Bifidobacterium sp. ESL0682 TaxID=2983212 RepID=UPI0023F6684C|nr:DUF805 domain-containing protein [Bifidobacterium sp. ESL0682]WEV41842.1 DUF805 domain-containing protein [Bifidobacterium sp. ESL0682]
MDDTNPETNGDYTNPTQDSNTGENPLNTFGDSTGTSPEQQYQAETTQTPSSESSTSEQQSAPEFNLVMPDLPSMPTPATQNENPATNATPYSGDIYAADSQNYGFASQPGSTQQFGSTSQAETVPQYNAPQADSAPQNSPIQQSASIPQYNTAQQTDGNVPPQGNPYQNEPYQGDSYQNAQYQPQYQGSAQPSGDAPIFPPVAPNQPPYGNQNPNNFAASPTVPLGLPFYGCPPVEAVKRFFLKYVKFSGRASRSEFWWTYLFIFLVNLVLNIVDSGLFRGNNNLFDTIWGLAILIPSIAIGIRRLHDSNRSGWWLMLPVGLVFGSTIIFIIAAIAGGISIGAAVSSTGRYTSGIGAGAGAGIVITAILLLICYIAAFIVAIVLMVAGPKPEGARFDEVPPMQAGMNGSYAPTMGQQNSFNGQYAQPGQYMPPTNQEQGNPYQTPATQQNPVNNPYTTSAETYGQNQNYSGEQPYTDANNVNNGNNNADNGFSQFPGNGENQAQQ